MAYGRNNGHKKGGLMKIKSADKLPVGTIIELEDDGKHYKVTACDRIDFCSDENYGLTLEEVQSAKV